MFKEKDVNESNTIYKKMNLDQKIFNIGFKDIQKSGKINDRVVLSKIILDILVGASSDFFEKLYSKGLLDTSFGFDYSFVKNAGGWFFSGVSKNPEDVLKFLTEQINNFLQKGFDENCFDIILKKHLGLFIKQFNYINSIVSMEADFFCKDTSTINQYNQYKQATFDLLDTRLKNGIDINNPFLSVVN